MSFCIFKHRLTYAKGEELLSQVRNGLENGSLVALVLGLMAAVTIIQDSDLGRVEYLCRGGCERILGFCSVWAKVAGP